MALPPSIRIIGSEFGRFPEAVRLNSSIRRGATLLRATLDIAWPETDARDALSMLERLLTAFSTSFRLHECRGPHGYHVFTDGRKVASPAAGTPAPAAAGARSNGFEGSLALAHLIEHVAIDFVCRITGQRRCSGVTGALRFPAGRFHLLLECPDRQSGRLALGLAVSVLMAGLAGRPPGGDERDLMRAARIVFEHPERPLTPPAVARTLDWTAERAGRALESLRDLGYVDSRNWSVNMSGCPEYRLAAGGTAAP
jgi:hypothetical protein